MTEQRKKPPMASPFDDEPIEDMPDHLSHEPVEDVVPEEPASPPPPPWDPAQHPISANVLSYVPGRRLMFEQGGHVGQASLLLLGSLFFGWLAGVLFQQLAFWVVGCTSLAGLYVLIQWKAGEYDSIVWRFDFEQKQLKIQASEEEFLYDLGDVTGVSVTIVEKDNWWSSTLAGQWRRYSYKSYNAQVLLLGVLEESDLVVAETGFQQSDRVDIHHTGACMAYALATSIDVPYIDGDAS